MGKVPTISIDKTDGCQMFLSENSKDVEIITAKSSEMNVMIPKDGDFVSVFLCPGARVCTNNIGKVKIPKIDNLSILHHVHMYISMSYLQVELIS